MQLADIMESEREEHPLTPFEPGKSLLLEIDTSTPTGVASLRHSALLILFTGLSQAAPG
jgi:hypothetical protein